MTSLAVTPNAAATGLVVLCRDCQGDFKTSQLKDYLCLECQAHRACADVRAELEAVIRRHRRYLARGARPDVDRVKRLQQRLVKRILTVVPDARKAIELASKEYEAIATSKGITGQRVVEVVNARQLITSIT